MKIVLQVVDKATVKVNQETVGKINRGFLLLVGFTLQDDRAIVEKMVDKLIPLRLFQDENGLTNLSLEDVKGEILSISQFTLYADTKKGRRPSFVSALKPELSKPLFTYFNELLATKGFHLESGIFGADMKVELINNGPFTVILDSQELFGGEGK